MSQRKVCPLCNGPVDAWFEVPGDWRRPQDDATYKLYKCKVDQFGFLLPTPVDTADFYNIESYYTRSRSSISITEEVSLLSRIRKHIAWRGDNGIHRDKRWWAELLGSAPLKICEIGCGSGRTLQELQELGHVVTGVEPDPSAAARNGKLTVFEGSAEELPYEIKTQQFDLVIMSHVLEHCIDPILSLRNIAGIMKMGGRVYIEVPNHACLGFKFSKLTWPNLGVPRHLYYFSPKSLEKVCQKVGISVRKFYFLGYCRQFSDNWINIDKKMALAFKKRQWSPNLRYWILLFLTLLTSPSKKYDSIAVLGELKQRPAETG